MLFNEGKTLPELELLTRKHGITVTPSNGKKILKKDHVFALQKHFLKERFPDGAYPRYLLERLVIESPMLCYRYVELKKEQQSEIWDSSNWVFEEKWRGERALLFYNRGDGFHIMSRNISNDDFLPLEFGNVLYTLDTGKLSLDHFVLDCEIVANNMGLKDIIESRGVVVENISQAVSALLAMEREQAMQIQRDDVPLYFRAVHVLGLGNDMRVATYREMSPLLDYAVGELQEVGLNIDRGEVVCGTAADKKNFYQRVMRRGAEGVIAKHIGSTYNSTERRVKDGWVKLKFNIAELFGDTIDGFIMGGEARPQDKVITTIHVGMYVIEDGEKKAYRVASISNLDDGFKKTITTVGIDGKPVIKPEFINRVIEMDAQRFSDFNGYRFERAEMVGIRYDRLPEDCILDVQKFRDRSRK